MEAKNYGSPNGNPSTIALRNRERSELKHLSRSRKKNQTEMSLLTASERDTVQTEASRFTPRRQCGVRADTKQLGFVRSLLERSTIQGDSPVSSTGSVDQFPE